MKRLINNTVNTLSFVKSINYVINDFDVILSKVVGDEVLQLNNLSSSNGLAVCSDFIILNIDLLSNNLEGGEYYLTLVNGNTETSYLCLVETHENSNGSTTVDTVYGDTVKFSPY
jgi:hypothetical protein